MGGGRKEGKEGERRAAASTTKSRNLILALRGAETGRSLLEDDLGAY